VKLLIDEKGRKYLADGEELHTKYGVVELAREKKGIVTSHLGHRFIVLEAGVGDLYERLPRSGSLILRKDLGAIVANTNLGSGSVVVDAGTGSGMLAIFLGNLVRPDGRVHTYEKCEEFAALAEKNIAKAGLEKWVKVKVGDVKKGIDEKPDLVTLDLNEPWKAIPAAQKALKRGGFICAYTPYMEHARRFYEELEKHGFVDLKTVETIERELEFKEQGTRPKTTRVGHTGYLTFGRRG